MLMWRLSLGVLFVFGVICAFGTTFPFSEPGYSEMVKGKYWETECTLLEENVDNGFFSNDTNRLNCGGVIMNVETTDYNKAINVYVVFTTVS